MRTLEVKNKKMANEFLRFPVLLYKNEPHWIRPLDRDINRVFDQKQNKIFQHGECKRWILKNQEGKMIGRIAAFVDKKIANKDNDQPTGGIGFFECINNQEATNLLFDTAKKWLIDLGMEAMDGPINFGDRDAWWGLLVNGFDKDPNYQCNYHLPYYQTLFETYGFQIYFKQFTFGRKIDNLLLERIQKKAKLVYQDPSYTFRHIDKKNLYQHVEDFRQVYNDAWARLPGVAKMESEQARALGEKMEPILDEEIIWFGYYEEKPVSFGIALPEMNQVFKHVNGKLNLWGKLIFLYHTIRKTNKKMLGLVFGVSSRHQGKGVDGAIMVAFQEILENKQYTYLEMNWIGDFNPKMIQVARQINSKIIKTHHTYRYLFDRIKEFKRMPIK